MSLLSLRNITLSTGGPPLIEQANLVIEAGDKVCVIGRNGVGKSTLLKLIQGDIEADAGIIDKKQNLRISSLPQQVPHDLCGKIFDIVAKAFSEYDFEDWQIQYRVDTVLSKLELNGESLFESLSGGLKRQVLLARAIVDEPDILLLDEPTNHLDIEAIIWLEKFLIDYTRTLIFITHDRTLTQKVATKIVEIDNGKLITWSGSYQDYLKHKEESLAAEAKLDDLFDKRLAAEEVWVRQGIKARRTRNEGRVRALKKMREERNARRVRLGSVKIAEQSVAYSGQIAFEITDLSFSYQDKCIIENFSTLIARGDKIGLIGPNGSGKSTFLKLLLNQLQPDKGTIKRGTQFEVAYFDQHRFQLDETKTIIDNVREGSDMITVGTEQKHIISYLRDFLFSAERARTRVSALSGGERNRVMLAKLFSKPCNLMILDEPTNDLDIETLELLEEHLVNFTGTLLLISHDREFLNNVVTSTFMFEGNGKIKEFIGGYDATLDSAPLTQSPEILPNKKSAKLSYQEKRELAKLPQKIEALEKEQALLQQKLMDPLIYKTDPDQAVTIKRRLEQIDEEIAVTYSLWETLDSKSSDEGK